MQRNAFLVERLIQWVNEQKALSGSSEQNVVLGMSMGEHGRPDCAVCLARHGNPTC